MGKRGVPKGYKFKKVDPRVRFFKNVEVDAASGCWFWTAFRWKSGYACFWFEGKNWRAHVWAITHIRGIEYSTNDLKNAQPDHTCRNPGCVNPWHTEIVTAKVNVSRCGSPAGINSRKTECIHNHPLSGANLYVTPEGRRQCRTCRARRIRECAERRALKLVV